MALIWATRGRAWGFRFLLDGGFSDPFPVYDSAFTGTEGESAVYRRIASQAVLRFPDPLGRRDEAGRVIPHDLVVLPPLADEVRSVEEGLLVVWPLIADFYAEIWDQAEPPSDPCIRIGRGWAGDQEDDGLEVPPNSGSADGSSRRVWKPEDRSLTLLAIVGIATIFAATRVSWKAIRGRWDPGREASKQKPRIKRYCANGTCKLRDSHRPGQD